MKTASAAIAALFLGTVAHASTISVTTFNYTDYDNAVTDKAVVEDFETAGDADTALDFDFKGPTNGGAGVQFGELTGSIGTSVGAFSSLGGEGTGSTARSFDRDGDKKAQTLALQYDPAVNGQGNIVPELGFWSLNSNDTLGVSWDAGLENGKAFDSLVLAIRDAADTGKRRLTITTEHETKIFTNFSNNNRQLVFIDFGVNVTEARIDFETSRNDGFTIDGAAINVVPLPAPALMLLGGLGALAGLRRRQKNKA